MDRSGPGDVSVLLPTGHDGSTYRCVRSLGKRGIASIVASEKSGVPAAASRFCTEFVSLPDPREELIAYRDALLSLAERESVRTIIPVRPEDSYLLSRYEDEFSEHVSLVVPGMDQMRAIQDRRELASIAEAAGVPVPDTQCLSEVEDWSDEKLIKSRYNVVADGLVEGIPPDELHVVKDIYHVGNDHAPDADVVRESMLHDPLVQEFIPKDAEYMFGGLYDHGEPLATFQHHQIRGNSYTGGGGVYRRSMYDPELQRVATTLLDHLDWHGLACIEYMKDERTGEYVLTEINPRMWQSLPTAVHAGADFPYNYWLAARGRQDEITNVHEMGVGTHQIHGELKYLASVLGDDSPHVERPSLTGTTWQIVSSILRDPHFDYFSIDDPVPFLVGLRNVLR